LSEVGEAVSILESEGKITKIGAELTHISSISGWARLTDTATKTLSEFHVMYPLRQGMPLQDFRGQLALKSGAFGAVLQSFTAEETVATDDATVRLPRHQPVLTPAQRSQASDYLGLLAKDRFSPSTERPVDIELLLFLVERGDVVRINDDVVYTADAYNEMESKILDSGSDGREITITSVRDLFGTSRKYTLAVLEHMDSKGLTRRVNDNRFVR
jgi:selenocysteine-specific elongation factor